MSDISPLAGLTNLQTLNLNWNHIKDISPLSGLTNLQRLNIDGSDVEDLSPLRPLTKLASLEAFDNEIVDVSPLSAMTNIRKLWLGSNHISDISPLNGVVKRFYLPSDSLSIDNQSVTLPDALIADSVQTPLQGALSPANVVPISTASGPVSLASDKQAWTFTGAGKATLNWSWTPPAGTFQGRVSFSGAISQTAAAPKVPTTLVDDEATAAHNTAVVIDVLANDGAPGEPSLDSASLRLLDGATPVDTLTTQNGTFSVEDGKIRFTPTSGFVGQVPEVRYQATNTDGISGSAAIHVTVEAAAPLPTTLRDVAVSTPAGKPVQIAPLANSGGPGEPDLDASTLRLLDGANPTRELSLKEGTFTVTGAEVVFIPAPSFAGKVTPVVYQVMNTDGVMGTATIDVTVTETANGSETQSKVLASTGSPSALPIAIGAAAMLIVGLGVFLAARLRRRDASE